MAFDAADAVKALDYKFMPYVDAKGVTPEPSDDQIRKMNIKLRSAVTAVTGEEFDPEDRKAVAAAFGKLTEDQLAKIDEHTLDAIVVVTGSQPSRDEIAALPYRIKRKYIASLIGDLNDPEGSATATSP